MHVVSVPYVLECVCFGRVVLVVEGGWQGHMSSSAMETVCVRIDSGDFDFAVCSRPCISVGEQ